MRLAGILGFFLGGVATTVVARRVERRGPYALPAAFALEAGAVDWSAALGSQAADCRRPISRQPSSPVCWGSPPWGCRARLPGSGERLSFDQRDDDKHHPARDRYDRFGVGAVAAATCAGRHESHPRVCGNQGSIEQALATNPRLLPRHGCRSRRLRADRPVVSAAGNRMISALSAWAQRAATPTRT